MSLPARGRTCWQRCQPPRARDESALVLLSRVGRARRRPRGPCSISFARPAAGASSARRVAAATPAAASSAVAFGPATRLAGAAAATSPSPPRTSHDGPGGVLHRCSCGPHGCGHCRTALRHSLVGLHGRLLGSSRRCVTRNPGPASCLRQAVTRDGVYAFVIDSALAADLVLTGSTLAVDAALVVDAALFVDAALVVDAALAMDAALADDAALVMGLGSRTAICCPAAGAAASFAARARTTESCARR